MSAAGPPQGARPPGGEGRAAPIGGDQPFALADAIFRNIIPLAGIIFFGWSAANVLILYFVDTLLAMAVMFAGLARHFLPPPTDEGWAARANAEVGYIGAALFIVAFMAVPLGVPLIFMLAGSDVSVRSLLDDAGFRTGLVLQAIAAFWSCWGLYRALQTYTPDELRLKRRFAFVFLRWMALIMVMYTGLPFLLGRYAPSIFVLVYTAATIMIEVAPDHFLRAMPGGAEDADPPPGAPASPAPPAVKPRWRDKKKR